MWSQEEFSEPGREIMACHWFSAPFLHQGLRNPGTAQSKSIFSPLERYWEFRGVPMDVLDLTGMQQHIDIPYSLEFLELAVPAMGHCESGSKGNCARVEGLQPR